MTTDTVVDDFWARQAALPFPHQRPITCLVCKQSGLAHAAHPQLCDLCGGDLPAARAHVVTMVLRCELRCEHALEAFECAFTAADTALQGRYHAYANAREQWEHESRQSEPDIDPAIIARVQTTETMARAGRVDPLLSLVRLWLDYQDAGEALGETQQWAMQCEAVL